MFVYLHANTRVYGLFQNQSEELWNDFQLNPPVVEWRRGDIGLIEGGPGEIGQSEDGINAPVVVSACEGVGSACSKM